MKLYITLALTLFVLLTNIRPGWNEGMRVLSIPDVRSYQTIAESAPSLPTLKMPYHHAQRFFGPYIAGVLSKTAGISPETAFHIITGFCIFSILLAIHRCLVLLELSSTAYALCISLLLLNPFLLRLYMIVPGMLPDMIFVAGLSLALYGLIGKRFYLIFIGAVIAVLGRQTALLLIPGLMVWLYAGSGWATNSLKRKLSHASAVTISVIALYFMAGLIASGFSGRSINIDHMTGLFRSFGDHDITVLGVLGYMSFIILPLLHPLAVITGISLASTGQNKPILKMSFDFWAGLILAAGIVLQPLLAGPGSSFSQGARLSAFAVVPLIVSLSCLLRESVVSREKKRDKKLWLWLLTSLLMVGSLHYKYTIIGPANLAQFVFIQAAVAVTVCSITYFTAIPE